MQALNIFQRVAQAKSFSRGAAALDIPRATATLAVQQLEAHYQVTLLHRTTRKVTLTSEGEQLLARSQPLLNEWEALDSLFRQPQSPSGHVRLSVPARLARLYLIPALAAFRERYPALTLHMDVSDSPVDLVGAGVDCALRIGALPSSRLHARALGEIAHVNCASPHYLARYGEPRSPAELDNHHMVGYASPISGRIDTWEWQHAGGLQKKALAHPVTVNSADAYIAAAVAGLGLAQTPAYDAEQHFREGRLQQILANYPPSPSPVHLLYPANRQNSLRLRVLGDWLKEVLVSAGVVTTFSHSTLNKP